MNRLDAAAAIDPDHFATHGRANMSPSGRFRPGVTEVPVSVRLRQSGKHQPEPPTDEQRDYSLVPASCVPMGIARASKIPAALLAFQGAAAVIGIDQSTVTLGV